ncbi:MAG TPA: methionine--tRNA ligase [Candidatus Wallbacteria bacterium]|nr:methionine--tRNA ligase [Candidatus Wallbacteria bacterium]
MEKRKIIVTAGLPYANGDVHLGHLVEYIQADIFVRYQKHSGNECLYICGNDTHGTPAMISARKLGIAPEVMVERMHTEQLKDFKSFHVDFDNFHTTHSEENRILTESIYAKAREKNLITERNIKQLYCDHDKMFLPDRFIKGTCPKCKAPDQYGDSCDVCSATYSVTDVLDAYCTICRNKPVMKDSTHFFFELSKLQKELSVWLEEDHMPVEVKNKLKEWFKDGLKDWDISRDEPYFGFKIPGTADKYFYVWYDAPVGYMASLTNWAKKNGKTFEQYWCDPKSEIYHFIGKDILYFHTLFWPAMLMAADIKRPDKIFIHGMLKVDNEKMSKSKGTFINAKTYLKYLHPEYLRYYYASKFNSGIEDINLSLNDFLYKVNSELVGNITNIASRVSGLLNKNFKGVICEMDADGKALFDSTAAASVEIAKSYEGREVSQVISRVIKLANDVNKYIDDSRPWSLVKENPEKCHKVLSAVLNCFKTFMVYLKPILPEYVAAAEELLNAGELRFGSAATILENHKINEFKPLITRIEQEKIDAMIEETKQDLLKAKALEPPVPGAPKNEAPTLPEITIEDFQKIDLRVAKIIDAKDVEGADKLLQLTLEVGTTTKNVFAGIKKNYKKEDLVGKLVVVVNNLKPRKMKFGMSEGMVLAASSGETLALLTPMADIASGGKIS